MELDQVCGELVGETDGLLVCAVLDLDTELVLAQAGRAGVDGGTVDRSMRTAGSMFRERLANRFARSLSDGNPAVGLLREAHVTTDRTYQFMSVVPDWESSLLVVVTDRSLSVGLGWMVVHEAIERISRSRAAAQPADPPAGREEPGHGEAEAAPAEEGARDEVPPDEVDARTPAVLPEEAPGEAAPTEAAPTAVRHEPAAPVLTEPAPRSDAAEVGRFGPRGAFFKAAKGTGG